MLFSVPCFSARYKQARAEAEPHWAAAETAEAKAKESARAAKEIADEIQRLKKPEIPLLKNTGETSRNEKEIARLEAKRARLLAAEAEERERAKQEQAIGDGIYWPIFNLDIKNPSAKEDFEHLPPEQLADDILQKEQRIAELMMEVKEALMRTSL
jgi:type I restriction enzyme M protein